MIVEGMEAEPADDGGGERTVVGTTLPTTISHCGKSDEQASGDEDAEDEFSEIEFQFLAG